MTTYSDGVLIICPSCGDESPLDMIRNEMIYDSGYHRIRPVCPRCGAPMDQVALTEGVDFQVM